MAAIKRSWAVDMPRAYPVVHSKFVNLTVSVLEMHPELRDGTEAIALSQDLHVEVGAPFLERTRDKLEERARAIMERRPELEHYFDDFTPAKAVSGHNPREAQLEAALRANAGASRPGRGTYRSLCCARVQQTHNHQRAHCPVRRAGPTRGAVACGASVG